MKIQYEDMHLLMNELDAVVSQETELLSQYQVALALKLCGRKKSLLEAYETLTQMWGEADIQEALTLDERVSLKEKANILKEKLLENEFSLQQAEHSHKRFLKICIEAIKMANAPIYLYNNYGKTHQKNLSLRAVALNQGL